MKKIDQLLQARWVLPIAPDNTVLENHSVAVDQGKIIDLLSTEQANQLYQARETVQLNDHVLMPGLINCHTHTPMNLFRGLADDLPLMDWLNNHIWPAEGELIDEESVAVGSRFAIAEMLRTGTTTFNDNYMFPHITAKVAIEEGMRSMIGLQAMDVPTKWAKDGKEALEKGLAIYHNTEPHPLINWSFAPQGPYTTTDDTFIKIRDAANELNLRVHLHLHETQAELQIDLEKYGKHPIQRLLDLNILNERLMAVHMVHLTDEEIAIIADNKVQVILCPESNLKLASGFAPINKMLKAGINVAVGTDGAASNNDLDMFGELRSASFVAKCASQDPTVLPAGQALELATINAAKALGLDQEIGSIEKNKQADLIAINLNHLITQPVYNPISHLAYAVNALQVSDVWVAGKQLLKQGEFTQLDLAKTMAESQKWAEKAKPFSSRASQVQTV